MKQTDDYRSGGDEIRRSIAARALKLDPAQRRAFVLSACENDSDTAEQILELVERAGVPTVVVPPETMEFGAQDYPKHSFAEEQIVDKRFQILAFLDEGGMGEVYAALDLSLQEKVALKTIRPAIAAHPGAIDGFKREVKQSLRITHPNVCRVHQLACHEDSGGDSIWFLTMELLEGTTLARRLADQPLPSDRTLALLRQIVSGLACAHEAGVVHRDLKPGNVIVTGPNSTRERAVITDFGLAQSATLTAESAGGGTPAYMAPEQVRRERVGPQADIYALGLMICEMLTGERPLLDRSSAVNHARDVKRWLSSHPKTNRELRHIIKRCLQFRPEDRFRDAREIVPLLEGRRSTKTGQVITAFISVAGLGALAIMLLRTQPERIINAVQLTPDSALSLEPDLSPSGKYITYVSNRADPESLDIWFQRVPVGTPTRLTKDMGNIGEPTISPDGKLVAFRSEHNGGGIYLVSTAGGSPRLIIPGGRNPAFSTDGSVIAYWQGNENSQLSGAVYLYSLTGAPLRRVGTDFSDARYPKWSLDGKLLLFYGCHSKSARTGCPDWWAVNLRGGPAIATGAIPLMRREGVEPDLPPSVGFRNGHLLLSGRRGTKYHVWDLLTNGSMPRVSGNLLQITSGDIDEDEPTLTLTGAIALEHVSSALHIWRITIMPGGENSKAVKLTDALEPDCCPAVSRDGQALFFTRGLFDSQHELIKQDLAAARESVAYDSSDNKVWPLPDSKGEAVAYETKVGNQTSIALWKHGGSRVLCTRCAHPGAWLRDGSQLIYTTEAGDIAILNVSSGQSRTILRAAEGYSLTNPDWNPDTQQLLFTQTKKDGSKQIFAVRLAVDGDAPVGSWTALTSISEAADIARWSSDGSQFYYFSARDGFYCIWGNSFDSERQTIGTAFPVRHYHDWRSGPLLAVWYLMSLSVAQGSIYTNVGEVTSTIWVGQLQHSPFASFLREAFRR